MGDSLSHLDDLLDSVISFWISAFLPDDVEYIRGGQPLVV